MLKTAHTQYRHYALLLFLLTLLTLLMVYPLIQQIAAAFLDKGRPSLYWLSSVLSDATFRSQLITSLALGLTVTLLCNLIAFPLALIAARFDFRGKTLLAALVLVPMVLPPFVGAIGMKQLLGTFGSLTILLQHLHLLSPHEGINWLARGGFWALAALISLGLYPIAYLNLQAALANIDPAMLEAAQNLGGKRFANFRRITLPLAMPGIFAGSTIIFIWAFTELGTPLLLDYRRVVSRSIWDDLAQTVSATSDNSRAFAKVVLVLVVSVSAYIVGKLTLGRTSHAMTAKATVGSTTRQLSFSKGLLAAIPFILITGLAVLPHLTVVLYSFTAIASEPARGWGSPDIFGWYRSVLPSRYTLAGYAAVFGKPEIFQSILNSIKYASIATLLNMFLGIAIAWTVIRTRIKGRLLLDSIAMLPLAVPGLVMAFAFVAVLRQFGLRWIIETSPIYVLVIAYMVRRMPYLVRSVAGGLQQTSVTLEEAAANLGASPLRVLRKITLPLILANLIAGGILTFAFSMLEVSDSLILAQYPQHFPITKMIYVLGSDTSGPTNVRDACSLGVLAMMLLILTMTSAALLMGKKLGTIFRAT
ncbi:MAG: iron ABC transporter permease [Phycisphaerales bacterium]|nr:iron ABC transporter permease [Phycisphaerales bacterium]